MLTRYKNGNRKMAKEIRAMAINATVKWAKCRPLRNAL